MEQATRPGRSPDSIESLFEMNDTVLAIVVLAVWFIVMRFVLPRLGVST